MQGGAEYVKNDTNVELCEIRQQSIMGHPMKDEQGRGWLKNGNPPGDFTTAPRCGAQNRQGKPCRAPAIKGRVRCRLHGGKSTGAKTAAGIHRIRQAAWRHGLYSKRLQIECLAATEDTAEGFPESGQRQVQGRCSGPPTEWLEETETF